VKKLFITIVLTVTLLTSTSYAARDRTPPSTPTTLTATATNTTVTLSWKASKDNIAVKGYNVYRGQTKIAITITPNYVDNTVKPVTLYTYSVSAYDAAGNTSPRSTPVSITTLPNPPPPYSFPPLPPTSCGTECLPITSCGTLLAGNYILTNDVSNIGTCMVVNSTAVLDCGGHQITAEIPVDINGATGFKIRNCNLIAPLQAIRIQNSSNGTIQQNTLTGVYEQYYTTGTRISANTINSGTSAGAGLINTAFGSSNTIDNNIIDGKTITDDGILIQSETADIITLNTISNIWDCGLETLFTILDTTISYNTITNASLCGIGGWFYSSWRRNNVTSNIVTNSPYLFYFFRSGILPTETAVYFDNNIFTGNIANTFTTYGSYIDVSEEDNPVIPVGWLLTGNNIFTGNNFNSQYSPIIWPATLAIDGGGNRCGPPTFTHNMALSCNA
jgi:hypothetical protein